MLVYIADEASPVVTRYKNIGELDFDVNLLLTCTGKVQSRARILSKACKALNPRSVFVDSGAFIYQAKYFKHGVRPTVSEVEESVKAHFGSCYWLWKNGYPLKAVAEMDVPMLWDKGGHEIVSRWRHKYAYPFQEETDIPVVIAWHGGIPFQQFLDEERNLRYVGVSIFDKKRLIAEKFGSVARYYDNMALYIRDCYRSDILVHGYAVTRTDALKRIPFYSVDSITWQGAVHFGNAIAFDKKTGNMIRADIGKGIVKKKGARAVAKNILKLRRAGSKLSTLDAIGRTNVKGRPRADHIALFKDQAKVFDTMGIWFTKYWERKGVDWSVVEKAQGVA